MSLIDLFEIYHNLMPYPSFEHPRIKKLHFQLNTDLVEIFDPLCAGNITKLLDYLEEHYFHESLFISREYLIEVYFHINKELQSDEGFFTESFKWDELLANKETFIEEILKICEIKTENKLYTYQYNCLLYILRHIYTLKIPKELETEFIYNDWKGKNNLKKDRIDYNWIQALFIRYPSFKYIDNRYLSILINYLKINMNKLQVNSKYLIY